MKDTIIFLLLVTNIVCLLYIYQQNEKYSKYKPYIEKMETFKKKSGDALEDFQKELDKFFKN